MPLRPHRVALVLLLPLAASAAGASSDDPFFEPLPVVLSASRLAQPLLDSPGAVSVIDADLIAATGYRELARCAWCRASRSARSAATCSG